MSDFVSWLEGLGLGGYSAVLRENAVDFDVVRDLTDADLRELGFPLGDRKRLLAGIASLPRRDGLAESAAPFTGTSGYPDAAPDELRQLTLVFVDLVGSTALSSELGLEGYREALQLYQNACLGAIRTHFGYVAQFLGDGVVAYFGYPVAEENDAERAVLAGMQIVRTVGDIDMPSGHRLAARVGIATGDVLIGDIMSPGMGAARGGDHFALGEIPALASRLQSMAEPGQVAISDSTRQILGGNFECRSIGAHDIKGFSEPVGVWIVDAARTVELRFQARQHGAIAPLVGREHESGLLVSRWSDTLEGRGQAIFLSGEAGIGKSRLAQHVTTHALETDALRLSFQCSPYHQNSAFYPVALHLAHATGVDASDPAPANVEKIRAFSERIGDTAPETLSVYAELLSIADDDGRPRLAPDVLKEKIFETMLRHLELASVGAPTLVLFEDLHWIDPSSEELLDRLIGRLAGMRALLICTSRPEYRVRWSDRPGVTTIALTRLDQGDARSLIEHLADQHDIPDDLARKIVDRAEGVPLFVEEMVRMVQSQRRLMEEGIEPVQDLQLPATLKDLLRAKIDHLPTARDAVSVCALVGRSFSLELAAAVYGTPVAQTRDLLDQLVEAQILVPRGAREREGYTFRHALIQDAAAEALLPRRARELHQRIAGIYLSKFPALAAQRMEVVAQHYRGAEMYAEARDAWEQAASTAMARFASQEAVAHLQAALDANEKAGDGPDSLRREVRLREALSVALEMRAWGSPDILANLDRLHALQQDVGTPRDVFLVLHGLCGTHLIAGNPDLAETYCAQMDELLALSAAADPAMETLAAHNNGMASLFLGRFDAAIRYFDAALDARGRADIAEINRYYPADPATIDTVMRAWAKALSRAAPETVLDDLPHAVSVVEAEANDFSRCYALSVIACIHQTLGRSADALIFAERALEISQTISFRYWEAWCKIVLGWARAREGSPNEGAAMLREGLQGYIATGSAQIVTYAKTLLADCLIEAGQRYEAAELLREVRSALVGSPIRFHDAITAVVERRLAEIPSSSG